MKKTTDELESDLEMLKSEMYAMRDDFEHLLSGLRDDVRLLERRLEDLDSDVRAVDRRVDNCESDHSSLQSTVSNLERR